MNTLEFADELTIQFDNTRVNIKGSLQSNTIQNNSGNNAPLQSVSWTLYTNYPIDNKYKLHSGTTLAINDCVYKVVDISDELGLATIRLHKGNGS